MSRLAIPLSVALGMLTSLAVPGASVALDIEPSCQARDIAGAEGALFVIGRAHLPGLSWCCICREAPLVNEVPRAAPDAERAASHVGWPSGDEVIGMLSAGWPWPYLDLVWVRRRLDDFPSDPRDNLTESGNIGGGIRRAISRTPDPAMAMSWTAFAASALLLAAPWWIALTLAARARRSGPAQAAQASAQP